MYFNDSFKFSNKMNDIYTSIYIVHVVSDTLVVYCFSMVVYLKQMVVYLLIVMVVFLCT